MNFKLQLTFLYAEYIIFTFLLTPFPHLLANFEIWGFCKIICSTKQREKNNNLKAKIISKRLTIKANHQLQLNQQFQQSY